jgi:N-sulfoglucosamine sulfohydrolase
MSHPISAAFGSCRGWPASVVLLFAAAVGGVGNSSAARAAGAAVGLPAARPNVVLFIADDLSLADCSIYNPASGIRTPNMERVAKDGMTFDGAFVASPSCAPSRAALLTGVYGQRTGAMFNHQPPNPAVKRWPAYFKEMGYEVAAIGKVAHYAQVKEYGFDHVSHFTYHDDACVTASIDWLAQRQGESAADGKGGGGRWADKPLCLLVGTNWPHVPWPQKTSYDPATVLVPSTQVDTAEYRRWRARYAEAVTSADRDLGLVYDAVRKQLGDDTLFLFTADHGSQFPFGKWNCYDAGLRSPLVAVWPGKVKPGTRSDALVSWVDVLPTCLAAGGGPVPPAGDASPPKGDADGNLSGRSFLKVLQGDGGPAAKSGWDVAHVFASHSGDGKMNEYPMRSVRTARWRYVRNLTPDAEFHSHVDKAQAEDGKGYFASWAEKAKTDPAAAATVARYFRRPPEELYDVQADPHELKNLAADPTHAATLAELRASVDGWMMAQGDEGLATEEKFRPTPPPAATRPAAKGGRKAAGKKAGQAE